MHSVFRKILTVTTTIMLSAVSLGAAEAKPLTVTILSNPADLDDPKNGIAVIMKQVWAADIPNQLGAYGFAYSLFEADGKKYVVSALQGSDCQRLECEWQVQRLTPAYEVAASGKKLLACGEINRLDFSNGRLTICGKEAGLP